MKHIKNYKDIVLEKHTIDEGKMLSVINDIINTLIK